MGHSAERRLVVAVIGNASTSLPDTTTALAEAIGRGLVDAGCHVVTGGMTGIMEAASRGARSSEHCGDGSVIGILPGYDRRTANPYVQIAIATGLQLARNTLVVASADAVIAVGGGSGTLSEIAMAWQLGKPIVAVDCVAGWSQELAGRCVDDRGDVAIAEASTAEEAVRAAVALARASNTEPGNVGSGWRKR